VAAPRTIVITGCSSPEGIGFATARALAARGHRVHATVRDHSSDDALRAGVEQQLVVHHLDLTDTATLDAVVDAVVRADGSLDVLINNAGYGLIGGIEQVDLDRARANLETNYFGTMELIQRVLPVMRAQKHGHIVNVSSIFVSGLCPPAIGYYVATKAALETACQALALELAPWNVRVTNYQPGPVMTNLSREWGDRLGGEQDPQPSLSDDLYAWVAGPDAPTPQSPAEVGDDLAAFLDADEPSGLASQSGRAAHEYVAAALHDPTRANELAALLAAFGRARTRDAA
jgi:NAD(P)-dependent dehydrogenase (short-subunit alcohol dehydrogenase family)